VLDRAARARRKQRRAPGKLRAGDEPAFVEASGGPLSDHPALSARVAWDVTEEALVSATRP
jgi:hypothetical protein